MRLSWNEVRARAAAFAREWHDAAYEKGETQSFYNEFFEVFGVRRRTVARYEQHVAKLDDRSGFIDLFWPGVLIVEQKSAGRDLDKAYGQAGEYFDALAEHERPRYILVSDFQTFELYDLDEREKVAFALKDLPGHVEAFGFILGVQRRAFRDQDPVNVRAAELVGKLHDALFESGYRGHDLEQFLVRIVFCLFADDTGIFDRDIFLDFIETRMSEDGSDTGARLIELFQVLDTPESERHATRDEDLLRFPYVNGSLFDGPLRIPAFNAAMREKLLNACNFDWSNISPAVFGALFQSVMDPVERRAKGAHYTTEKNILKVIEPLFMDDLRAEFKRLKSRKDSRRWADLRRFQEKLGRLKFFDPACGCGNFLIIAYRELRALEMGVLKELHPRDWQSQRQTEALAETLSLVDVDQFYGIELGEFPARIAETALWMMDHIMNNRLSLEFGQTYARIPLDNSPHIVHGDALETDWSDLLEPEDCSFVFGNPPFVGAKFQTKAQRAQVHRIARLGKSGGTLDYVAAWFIKASEYVQCSTARIGFVATNSITQGEQVGQLWPILFQRGKLEIAFAHRTFAWGSDARGKAHVHVVILGLDRREQVRAEKRLFSYPDINGEPEAEPYLRPYVGAREYLQGGERSILALHFAPPEALARLPRLRERVAAVRSYREGRESAPTRKLAKTPTLYHVNVLPTASFLVVPKVSSERREYVPVGWLKPPTIPSDLVFVLQDATLGDFAMLTSAMHMAWLRHIGGRLKSDYRYSIGLVYNTFPTPPGYIEGTLDVSKLEPLASAVLGARDVHPDSTLANLYDPDLMPPDLRRAHRSLDRAVDQLYRGRAFASERERVEHLFMLYEKMRAPLEAGLKSRTNRRRRPPHVPN